MRNARYEKVRRGESWVLRRFANAKNKNVAHLLLAIKRCATLPRFSYLKLKYKNDTRQDFLVKCWP